MVLPFFLAVAVAVAVASGVCALAAKAIAAATGNRATQRWLRRDTNFCFMVIWDERRKGKNPRQTAEDAPWRGGCSTSWGFTGGKFMSGAGPTVRIDERRLIALATEMGRADEDVVAGVR